MRVPFARLFALVLGGLAVIGAVAALLVVANAGDGFTRCSVTGSFGWTLPLVAGAAIGTLAWMLQRDTRTSDRTQPTRATARCGSCGSAMMESWRLCPYCGDLTEDLPSTEECSTHPA